MDELPWVDGLTLGEVVRATARRHPDRDAMAFPLLGRRWTWAELDRHVDSVASGLIGLGVEPGEHVGIWAMNGPEWVLTHLATARIGAVLVNINPAYRAHELEQALTLADVATLVVGLPYKTSDFVGMVHALVPELKEDTSWRSGRLPALRRVLAIGPDRPAPGWIAWPEIEGKADAPTIAAREAATTADQVQNIQFTSGTTGLPKGAMLTHQNILRNAYEVMRRVDYSAEDRVCVPVPFYHCFGCVLGTAVCAVAGSAIVVPAPSFDAGATLAAIEAERCTSVYGVPTMFVAMLDHPERPGRDLSSLRTGIMAGSPCPLPLMRRVIDELGARQVTIGYGLTEASPIITQTAVDDPIEVRVATVGRPLPGVAVKLIDPISGADVPNAAGPGELCTRGHGVMRGYYNHPEATARAISPDGWLRTGDLAERRADGCYKIVGRSKELIIRGGENIYPPEIEEFLCHHPAIAEVAVVGLPDAHYGEAVAAWVVPRPGATLSPEEVRGFLTGRLAHYKVPKYVAVVDQLPRTVTGKVQKFVLRERGIETHGLQAEAATPTA